MKIDILSRTTKARRHNISEKPFGYLQAVQDFRRIFLDQNSPFNYFYMLEIRNVSDFSSRCFGRHISDIVSDIRKPFRISYEASPKSRSCRVVYIICLFKESSVLSDNQEVTSKTLQHTQWNACVFVSLPSSGYHYMVYVLITRSAYPRRKDIVAISLLLKCLFLNQPVVEVSYCNFFTSFFLTF